MLRSLERKSYKEPLELLGVFSLEKMAGVERAFHVEDGENVLYLGSFQLQGCIFQLDIRK